ncbi:(2Fe-2S) ferredoxin domain-containing protein [Thiospirillum jenense]|uniref:(2Fe-2S) ferredoxin domain-containing protein n=1 Tax=Thiospirillum jenense TaxID=1653858 RepID=A0A839HCM2_9GAMM|nr:(2Fe-2S) ferredoxin domain-containing protein [Thiospirillum jenense]MBB1125166.1 (2Fe-2S) ferredoxin domain-containing protein [Thiospirillum jenense]
MSYYRHHIFCCINQRPDGRSCCAQSNAHAAHAYLKRRSKELKLDGAGGMRINSAGCLNRCAEGPVLVVYPEAIWYSYRDDSDLEEILQHHLLGGQPVTRLRLPDHGE